MTETALPAPPDRRLSVAPMMDWRETLIFSIG
ncbi:hypothetical protein SAMN06265365_11715 [Tistlia consotensis]|uniref:Uncharacterized protein n=1 Tax=Tistlia consotensis USBA 355 TaxID=560819 RepID=A0A1Y6CEN7_9PROT|nr:hypothetical protein SAMN05428998_118104 [Tistlia consotensis USBA 355]SNR83160.1 hypothetical protein SAMN06265365_11715 [Tistlia consotensis]